MLKQIAILVAFGVVYSSAADDKLPGPDSTTSRPPIEDISYFDCTGDIGGYHAHPWDCTRFIKCDNGRAHDFPCPTCLISQGQGCAGYLHWSVAHTTCDWPANAKCSGGVSPTPSATPSPTTASPNPPESCDPKDCFQRGNCTEYEICDPDLGIWITKECPDGLWWDDESTSAAGPSVDLHGGLCVPWVNLSDKLKDLCVEPTTTTTTTTTVAPPDDCDWYPLGECSDGYVYNHPIRTGGLNVTLKCVGNVAGSALTILWNQEEKTCDNCWNVKDNSGYACCDRPAPTAAPELFDCVGIEDGVYRNERDCRTFWKCLGEREAKISCPDGGVFNPTEGACEPLEMARHFCVAGELV